MKFSVTRALSGGKAFPAMTVDGKHHILYDISKGDDRLQAVARWSSRLVHWSGCGAVLRRHLVSYVGTHFILCTGEEAYMRVD